ncbi:hypothetical protein V2J09_008850 [Rumex salicifolius]
MQSLQMKTFFFFYLSFLGLVIPSHSETVVVDGVNDWKNPIVNIGDSIIFRHKFHYSLYIFRSRLAFNLCNFTEATLLTNPNSSSYSWRPTRLGNFYFSFNNGTNELCQQGKKLAIKVIPQTTTTPNTVLPPSASVDPPRSSPGGGISASSPGYPWPFQPYEQPTEPGGGPAPASATVTTPLVAAGKGGAIPFIDSNPAVPLPTGEVDSATTVSPLPDLATNHAIRVSPTFPLLCNIIKT